MAKKPLLWVEVGAYALRKRPERDGVRWSGQALEVNTQRKREGFQELIHKAKAFEAEK